MTSDPASAVRREEFHERGATGHALFRRSWTPAAPNEARRSVVLVHGYAEHCGRYEHVAARLVAEGCSVHAFDLQGHGRSEGRRCHVRRFDDFLDDLSGVVQSVRAGTPALPLFVVGHSMGGLIVSAWARERQREVRDVDVRGVATSGAVLAPPDGVSRSRMLAARWLSRLLPTFGIGSDLDPSGLSRDPEVVRGYVEDPLVESKMTLSLGAELMSAVARTSGGAGDVRVPMLLLHGDEDPLCAAQGSRDFFDGLAVERRIHVYPGLRHEIFNEPEHPKVLDDLLAWMREREAA